MDSINSMFLALACLFQAGEEFVTQLGMALGSRGNRQVPRELQGPNHGDEDLGNL